jgi:hypothetical protein
LTEHATKKTVIRDELKRKCAIDECEERCDRIMRWKIVSAVRIGYVGGCPGGGAAGYPKAVGGNIDIAIG